MQKARIVASVRMTTLGEADQIRRLMQVGRALMAEHDTEGVLNRILEEARAITGARYAALGVLDESRAQLERFVAVGIDARSRRSIGELPRGRGVLGALIDDPRPLRLANVGDHPQSYGFPAPHPPMHSFLGVPIMIRGEPWGNLYLTEKEGADEFTDGDEEAAILLAQWAATAIENARLYESSELRRKQLERAVRSLEASRDVADAISATSDLHRILELIVKRGRALVSARIVLIMLREGNELVVAASAGEVADAQGHRVPISGSSSGRVLEQGCAERITDVDAHLMIAPKDLGVTDARSALLVPMLHRGTGLGVLAAFDRGFDREPFTVEDEQLLRTFAAAASNAVAVNRSVESERLRSTIAAADAERGRFARELHDQTLQSLGGLRVALSSALGRDDPGAKDSAIRQAIEDVQVEIDNLRAIISDLRPSMLDDLGLLPAIEALLERRRESGLEVVSELALPDPHAGEANLDRDLETTIYRIVQEAMTNVSKHAQADTVEVSVGLSDGSVVIEVRDDGVGFDTSEQTTGFGLAGMRERVYLAGGTLAVESTNPGTRVRTRLPIVPSITGAWRSADQMAG